MFVVYDCLLLLRNHNIVLFTVSADPEEIIFIFLCRMESMHVFNYKGTLSEAEWRIAR